MTGTEAGLICKLLHIEDNDFITSVSSEYYSAFHENELTLYVSVLTTAVIADDVSEFKGHSDYCPLVLICFLSGLKISGVMESE